MANELEKLQKIWYKKLKDEGFQDIEDSTHAQYNNMSLKLINRTAPNVDGLTEIQQEMIREYYTRCRHFLNDHQFESDLDKTIWEHYSEGVSVRKISDKLKTNGIVKKKTAVHQVVKRLEAIMKAKYDDFN